MVIFQGTDKLLTDCRTELKDPNLLKLNASSKVSVIIKEQLKEELDRIIVLGIIKHTEEPKVQTLFLVNVGKKEEFFYFVLNNPPVPPKKNP